MTSNRVDFVWVLLKNQEGVLRQATKCPKSLEIEVSAQIYLYSRLDICTPITIYGSTQAVLRKYISDSWKYLYEKYLIIRQRCMPKCLFAWEQGARARKLLSWAELVEQAVLFQVKQSHHTLIYVEEPHFQLVGFFCLKGIVPSNQIVVGSVRCFNVSSTQINR